MDREGVQAWLDRYVEAWQTYDASLIGELFSPDADYRYRPSDEPVHGRDAIVESWLTPRGPASARDEPGTFEGRYAPFAVEGDRAVAVGSTRYWTDVSRAALDKAYDNAWLLEFDPSGRCRSFTEFFMRRREPA
jgi:uncharacterized protein (TIGR02246 family)